MISGGDELGRTQGGNNNAYCQDNELSWTSWDLTLEQQQFLAFTRRLVRFRRSQPVLMRRKYFQGRAIRGADVKDIYWLDPSGREMTDEAWNAASGDIASVLMVSDALDEIDEQGRPCAATTAHPVQRPPRGRHVRCSASAQYGGSVWTRLPHMSGAALRRSTTYELQGRTLAVF
jgi:pullulanase/glycogen debranching enzyme